MSNGARIVSVRIGSDPGSRLDKALARDVPEAENLSRSRLARMIDAGAVALNGTVTTDARAKVAEGDIATLTVAAAAESDIPAQDIPLDIRFEDPHLLVVNKRAGMVVHPAPGSPSGTLVNALLHHFGGNLSGVGGERRPGIVHRLDKDTSGLLVVAKSDRAHHGLAAQFAERGVDRVYRAICFGVPDAADPRLRSVPGIGFEAGTVLKIVTRLARHKTDRQRQAVVFQGGRHAVTRVRLEEGFGAAAAISCRLETGRTHQIRVHLAHAGHGLIGDRTYGGRRRMSERILGAGVAAAVNGFPRQALHGARLGFTHPVTGDRLTFEAALPPDMADLLTLLRQGGA